MKTRHQSDVCREGLGKTCADDRKLLSGFCLIAYSSKLSLAGKMAGKAESRNQFLHCFRGVDISILKIYQLADAGTV